MHFSLFFIFLFFWIKVFLRQNLISTKLICDLNYSLKINITTNKERETANKVEKIQSIINNWAGKIVFWYTKVHAPKSKFRKTFSTSWFFAPCNVRRYTCSPHQVSCHVPNEIDCGKKNVQTIQVQLYPPEWPHWNGDIKTHWRSSGVVIVNFEKIPYLFLVFHCWIWESVADCFYQQRSR